MHGLFPSGIEALGDIGLNLASAAYWHKAFPYKSTLTGVSGTELADGYEAASGKQWTQQLGATMSLFDAGFAAIKASADPKDKGAVAKAISTLKTDTMIGKVDFTSGPVPNVSPGPIIGTLAILSFLGMWNDFLLPLIVLRDQDLFTLGVGLIYLDGEYVKQWGQIMAAYFVASIPLIIVFLFTMRLFVRGLSAGAIKG